MKPAILLMKGKGIISKMIQWQTRSIYSHAAFLLPDGRILESWQGAGVRIRDYPQGPGITTFDVQISDRRWDDVLNFAHSQVGRPYDYLAVARFITRENDGENTSWFCSELVFEAFSCAGCQLLERVQSWEVSPALLSMSPLLVERS